MDNSNKTAHFLLRLTPSLIPIGTIRGYELEHAGDKEKTTTGKTATRSFKLSRLAVLKEYRSYRFGAALVEALHTWVREQATGTGDELVEVVCHSQIPAKGFYAKCVSIPS